MKAEIKATGKRELSRIEMVGMGMVALLLIALFAIPGDFSGIFKAMFDKVHGSVVPIFLTGSVGMAIIVSVMTGRILERLGFTDALMRLFVGIMGKLGINSAVVIPGIYNILGDINAAGRITGPLLKKAGATKDEQKMAVCTMVQSQQSFSTFMLGLLCLTNAGIKAFPLIIITVFAPLIIVPIILKLTIYRDTKPVKLDELPRFTPTTPALPTLFGAAKEGAEVLFLIIIPAVSAIFAIIGALEYLQIWPYINSALTKMLEILAIDPATGITSIMISPTLAMAQLVETAANLDPRWVVGSFVLAASGFPFSVIFGQIPAIWAASSDLNEKEAMNAAVLGAVMRLLTAGVVAYALTPLLL